MNAKFQAKTKELDEKFAAIPKGVKRQSTIGIDLSGAR